MLCLAPSGLIKFFDIALFVVLDALRVACLLPQEPDDIHLDPSSNRQNAPRRHRKDLNAGSADCVDP